MLDRKFPKEPQTTSSSQWIFVRFGRCVQRDTTGKCVRVDPIFSVYKQGEYYFQTKSCRPVDRGPVCSGPKGYYLQTIYLADQVLSIPISNIFIMVSRGYFWGIGHLQVFCFGFFCFCCCFFFFFFFLFFVTIKSDFFFFFFLFFFFFFFGLSKFLVFLWHCKIQD